MWNNHDSRSFSSGNRRHLIPCSPGSKVLPHPESNIAIRKEVAVTGHLEVVNQGRCGKNIWYPCRKMIYISIYEYIYLYIFFSPQFAQFLGGQ